MCHFQTVYNSEIILFVYQPDRKDTCNGSPNNYAISSSWDLFHNEIQNTKYLSKKNMYPPYLVDKQVKLLLNNKLSENDTSKEKSKESKSKQKTTTNYHTLVTSL